MKIIFLVVSAFCLMLSSTCHPLPSTAKVTIKVIGEKGESIEGARVGMGFDDTLSPTKDHSVVRTSDKKGEVEGTSVTSSGYVGFIVTKGGYYLTSGHYQFKSNNLIVWGPWNPTLTVTLRKVENPVPMYARRIRKEIPFPNIEIGFDLVKCDWVAPYGQGTTSDFTAYFHPDDAGPNDFEYNLRVRFPGAFNGVYSVTEDIDTGSAYRLPRYANLDGYSDSVNVYWIGLKRGAKASWEMNHHYVFRIRSETKDNKFIRGMYGKIISDFQLSSNRRTGKLPSLEFIYYLNPDYTNNLEFDPQENLFGELPITEQVSRP